MVLYKIGKDEGFNPLFPVLLNLNVQRYVFIVSRQDSFTAAMTVFFSAILLAIAVACLVMPMAAEGNLSSAVPLSLAMVLWPLLRGRFFPREWQSIEAGDPKQVGIGKGVFLAEWVVVCSTVMMFFMLAARDTGFGFMYILAMVFVALIFVPLIDVSLYLLRTNRMR